jgi:hypothetical protein
VDHPTQESSGVEGLQGQLANHRGYNPTRDVLGKSPVLAFVVALNDRSSTSRTIK